MITAVVGQHRAVAYVASRYGVAHSWVYEWLARFRAPAGQVAFESRSRCARTSPPAIAPELVAAVLSERDRLVASGRVAEP